MKHLNFAHVLDFQEFIPAFPPQGYQLCCWGFNEKGESKCGADNYMAEFLECEETLTAYDRMCLFRVWDMRTGTCCCWLPRWYFYQKSFSTCYLPCRLPSSVYIRARATNLISVPNKPEQGESVEYEPLTQQGRHVRFFPWESNVRSRLMKVNIVLGRSCQEGMLWSALVRWPIERAVNSEIQAIHFN